MERMDVARRVGGAVWVVAGLAATAAWMLSTPPNAPGPVTWVVVGVLTLAAVVQLGSGRPAARWWAGRSIGIVIGAELLGAVADRFGLWGAPGAPGVSWGDWAHFRAETAQLVPWSALVPAAAVAATVAELTLGAVLLAGLWWRWVGKATAGLFTVYLVAMIVGTGWGSVLEYGVPVLLGGALLASARGPRPRRSAMARTLEVRGGSAG